MLKIKERAILLVLIFFLIVTLLVLCREATNIETNMLFYFSILEDRIVCWERENNVYVFLPSYANLEEVHIRLIASVDITINNSSITDGMCCGSFEIDVPYELSYTVWGNKCSKKIYFMKSSNVGTMFINTASGNMDYVHESKDNKEDGMIRVYTQDGNLNFEGNLLSINGRGNATWTNYEKKPYGIKLETEADLLGLGKAQKWVLLANAADASNVRNKIVYDFSKKIGMPYSSDSQWIDLYLNGEYAGLYLLCEKNEVHPERVNVSDKYGFLLSIEVEDRLKAQQLPFIITENQQALRIHYPIDVTNEMQTWLTHRFQQVENSILSNNSLDEEHMKEIEKLIDVDSWVLNYLIDEIFGNLDGFLASRYFYIDVESGDERIYAGPVWDYDKAIGNDEDPTWSITNPDILVVNRYYGTQCRELSWAEYLYNHLWFRQKLENVFCEVMKPAIEELLNSTIAVYVQQITDAVKLDYIRWDIDSAYDFNEEIDQLCMYIKEHMYFLENLWMDKQKVCQIRFIGGGNDLFYSVNIGETIEATPCVNSTDERVFCGWYYSTTDEYFDITQPIMEDMEIYAKWMDSPSKRIRKVYQIVPFAVITVIGAILAIIDLRRWRKYR